MLFLPPGKEYPAPPPMWDVGRYYATLAQHYTTEWEKYFAAEEARRKAEEARREAEEDRIAEQYGQANRKVADVMDAFFAEAATLFVGEWSS